ncbi:MAG TPA: HEAT repeat domain-containing protein [Terriglobales bacterium]|jgi:anti-sigma factor RsiW|nr:HEAT repeat domain-containing protein [Terriglobales bacterium]
MKCDWVRQNILFYVYNELEDDARYEVEQHLARCPECATELKATRKFHATLSEMPVAEPTPNLLTASRMRLQEALETTRQGGFWQRLVLEPATWLRQIRMSPALAAVIFIVGFGGGIGATYNFLASGRVGDIAVVNRTDTPPLESSAIAGIRSVTQEPGSNQVSIKYDTVLTQEAQGSLNDQRIQQLLLFAARNNYNSGVRMDSVDLLTQAPDDSRVREALMYALQNDTNPGVRLKALDGLSGFVRQDPQVRDGVLRALISDTNSGVRMQALRLVEPMKKDSNVRSVLTRLSQTDQNLSIRSQARTMLAQMPEMD